MVIAGSDRTTRRRGARRQRDPSVASYGPELRQARTQLDLALDVIQDRTGIRSRDLEALENGDLSGFRDERAALVAVRRYADTVGLDAIPMSLAVEAQWRSVADAASAALTGMTPQTRGDVRHGPSIPVLAGPVLGGAVSGGPATTGPVVTRPAASGPVLSGPVISRPTPSPATSRPVGDSPHLRAFTQTAQVPRVAGAAPVRPTLPPGLRFDSTDAIPVTQRQTYQPPPPTSTSLRVAIWTLVLLLFVGVAVISVDHWRPGWLAKIHLTASGPAATTTPHGAKPGAKAPIVTSTPSGANGSTVTVHSSAFQVVVATQGPCWINVTSPASSVPVFSSTVPAGTTEIYTSVNGHLSVELGASRVLVAVQILGKTVPGWILAPSAVPYVATFHSASS